MRSLWRRSIVRQNIEAWKSLCRHAGHSLPIFASPPAVIQGARYHSLAMDASAIPEAPALTAEAEDVEIMGVRHRDFHVYGAQFHPESILTPEGKGIVANFLSLREEQVHD